MATKETSEMNVCRRLSGDYESDARTPFTVRRYTPYKKSSQHSKHVSRTALPSQQRKPNARNQEHRQPSRKDPDNGRKEHTEGVSYLVVGKTWRIYRASPFYRLKLDRNSFKIYERQLNAWLLMESSNGTEAQVKKRTLFRKVEGESDNDYGIEIKVFSNKGKESGKKEAAELIALLCCGRNNQRQTIVDQTVGQRIVSMVAYGDTELTSLPICLIKSTVLLREAFLQWLEVQFGCRVSPLLFSPVDLSWLVSLCSGIGEPLHSTELTYSVPPKVPGLQTISFDMAAKDVKKIWDSIHSSRADFFTSEEALKFLKSLESHFYQHFKIHLDQMQLTTIGTSIAYIGREGRVKIFEKDYVCYILQQFVQLANL